MNINNLLPIGSVVSLKEEKKLMIFGVKQSNAKTKKEFDYIAVLYPEGNLGNGGQILFNHDDISKIVFKGYEDDERIVFITKLDEFYSKKEAEN